MRSSSLATLAFTLGFAMALAVSQALSQGAAPSNPQPSAADVPPPEPRSITGDRKLDALVFGLASVSVDAEAAIIRINSLEDRINAMEKRLSAVEGKQTR